MRSDSFQSHRVVKASDIYACNDNLHLLAPTLEILVTRRVMETGLLHDGAGARGGTVGTQGSEWRGWAQEPE